MSSPSYAAPETASEVRLKPSTKVLLAAACLAAACYFPWRLTTFNPHALALSWLVYAAEAFGVVTLLLHVFMTSRVLARVSPPPLAGVNVDIFITTFNEPVSLVRRTLSAAKHVRGAARIVLLDDGARPAMAAVAAELGVVYCARGDNNHAKAGNLNFGLAQSTADFVATFDADHAPAPDFLEKTLGYFADARVAFVQTPQDFYNLDSIQHRGKPGSNRVWTEQSLFFRVIQPGKDRWNAAFYCGSCAVLRRSALDLIGGFATGTIAEDLHTSLKLHKAGFKSVYHAQSLAFGVSPATFDPYDVQRVRWGQGAMQVWRKEGVVFARGLSPAQRLCYLASIITYFDGWQKAIFYALPPYVLISGVMPMIRIDWEFLVRFLPWFGLSIVLCEELGRGYGRTLQIEQYNFLRFPAFLKATFALIAPRGLRFRVTRKNANGADASGKKLRWLALVPVLALAAIPLGVARYLMQGHLPLGALVSNAIWALLSSAVAISAIAFAARKRERRGDYRFLAPFALNVHLPSGGWGALRAMDMTPDGVRLAAPLGLDLAVGAKVDAILHLPSGDAPVKLRIRHRALVEDGATPKRIEVGAAVTWNNPADADALAACLYGSGLEHRLRALCERAPTLLGRHGESPAAPEEIIAQRAWAPGIIGQGADAVNVAAQPLTPGGNEWRVFSFSPLKDGSLMRLTSASGEARATLRVANSETILAGDGAMHLSAVTLDLQRAQAPAERRVMISALAGVASVFALVGAAVAMAPNARSETMALAGAEGGDHSSYEYAGVIAPLPGARLGEGWAARIWADHLSYSYDQNGARVEAEGNGGEIAAVRQSSGPWGYSNVSAGVRYRDTSLSPDDRGNRARGGKADVTVQADGRAAVKDKWSVSWVAQHAFDQQQTFARIGVDRAVSAHTRVGVDVTRGQDPSYGQTQAGLTAAYQSDHGWTAGARVGAERNDDHGGASAYVGLNLALALH